MDEKTVDYLNKASTSIVDVLEREYQVEGGVKMSKIPLKQLLGCMSYRLDKMELNEDIMEISDIIELATRQILEVKFNEQILTLGEVEAFLASGKKLVVERFGREVITQLNLRKVLNNCSSLVNVAFSSQVMEYLRKASNAYGYILWDEIERYLYYYRSGMIRYSGLLRLSSDLVHISSDNLRTHLETRLEEYRNPKFSQKEDEYFACYTERLFSFLLDGHQNYLVPVKTLLFTGLLEEFEQSLQQRNTGSNDESNLISLWDKFCDALRDFKEIDLDQNGMLSLDEMLQYYEARPFSSHFLKQIFETQKTYDMELDFQGFVEFLVATQYRKCQASIRYMFACLDLNQDGYLTDDEIRVAAEDVLQSAPERFNSINLEILVDEIFDIVNPAQKEKITMEDLEKCKLIEWVTGLLTSVEGLYQYEIREDMLNQQDGEPEDDNY